MEKKLLRVYAVYYPDVPTLERVKGTENGQRKEPAASEETEETTAQAKNEIPASMKNRPLPDIPTDVTKVSYYLVTSSDDEMWPKSECICCGMYVLCPAAIAYRPSS